MYALYKGEEVLAIGSLFEIANKMNVGYRTIQYYRTNAYKKKVAKRNSKNFRELIEI